MCYLKLVDYIKTLGLDVNLHTKARGHGGFFLDKANRIDISVKVPEDKIAQTILHEFAHYIHCKLDNDVNKTKGSVSHIFQTDEDIFDELVKVTNFVDESSMLLKLKHHRELVKSKIKEQERIIKLSYPKFQRSKPFKEFNRAMRFSDARYLLKYDRVKLVTPFLRRVKLYSIDNLENDFEISKPFAAYIRLRSYQKKQARISQRINRLNKYYTCATELFARFVEGVYLD